jgi:Ca-activated chloride channel family protein
MMRPLAFIICLSAAIQFTNAQYYVRGELKDEKGMGLPGARISLYSKGNYPFYTGSSGAFGIPSNLKIDTITFSLEGYDTLKVPVVTSQFGTFRMKVKNRRPLAANTQLASFTRNLVPENNLSNYDDGETYSSTIENAFVNAKNFPETGFSIHVDRASYSNIRRFLHQKEKPPPDAVRIEEMLNYFNLCTKASTSQKQAFSFKTDITSCPWNRASNLLFINLHAKKIDLDKTPAANLIFLIDISGSMDMANRLPLLKSAFKLLVENLRPNDLVSIVTYGDEVTQLLPPTGGDSKQKIIEAIEGLYPNGSTPGASAIRTAYTLARRTFIPGGNNRVILATDGDFNVGQTTEKELEELIAKESKGGIYLTCLGVGMGNYKDSKLEVLAKTGNGNFAYLDKESEAEKVLVEEFAQTLYTIADNVYLSATFNPQLVKEYRLIGFDNKKNVLADTSTHLQGGEVGSGHSLMAAFEIILQNPSDFPKIIENKLSLASFQLSYQLPGNDVPVREKYQCVFKSPQALKPDPCLSFASSIILFGMMLKQSQYLDGFSWDDLYDLAASSANPKDLLQKEFVDLIGKARKIYPNLKKKKG